MNWQKDREPYLLCGKPKEQNRNMSAWADLEVDAIKGTKQPSRLSPTPVLISRWFSAGSNCTHLSPPPPPPPTPALVPRRYLATSKDSRLLQLWSGGLSDTEIWWAEATGIAAKHPAKHRTGPYTKDFQFQNINNTVAWEHLLYFSHWDWDWETWLPLVLLLTSPGPLASHLPSLGAFVTSSTYWAD